MTSYLLIEIAQQPRERLPELWVGGDVDEQIDGEVEGDQRQTDVLEHEAVQLGGALLTRVDRVVSRLGRDVKQIFHHAPLAQVGRKGKCKCEAGGGDQSHGEVLDAFRPVPAHALAKVKVGQRRRLESSRLEDEERVGEDEQDVGQTIEKEFVAVLHYLREVVAVMFSDLVSVAWIVHV